LAIETIGRPTTDPGAGILYSLAKLERLRGLAPRTLEPPKTVSHMANPDAGQQLSGEQLPSITFQCSGARSEAEHTEEGTLNLAVTLAMRVNVQGNTKRDTLRRRDWTAFAAIETLMVRMPRHSLVARIDLADFEPVEHGDDKRIRGEYSVVFNVWIPDAVRLVGNVAQSGGPSAGLPGPYDPPFDDAVVTDADFAVTKVPLTEDV
jgi:hypothetical protein